ncbi:gap junction delta-4 protein isoform 1-T2 [Menidia menidia]
MVVSSASELLFISVNQSITLMGKVWLIVMVFLRILILFFAGFPLYQDEQERFVCNTIQPGCVNVCYDLFSPISLFRFWLVQLITLSLPYILFVIYVIHKVSNTLWVAHNSSEHGNASQLFEVPQEPLNKKSSVKERGTAQCFSGAYIVHLLFRTLLEAGFGAAHYYLFGFYIPRRFLCHHAPCTTQVDCYISRPTEKTVMLNFMLGVAAFSLLLNILDFLCAVKRSVKKKRKKKMMVEKLFEEEHCLASTGTATDAALVQPGLKEQSEKIRNFRKRCGSKESCGGGTLNLSQETQPPERCFHPRSPGSPNCNGSNIYSLHEGEPLERNGSEVALCPQETTGTPRPIRVNKRSRLKPPPPPRRDLEFPTGGPAAPTGDASTANGVCSRSMGQYTLIELSDAVDSKNNGDGQEKLSEWV